MGGTEQGPLAALDKLGHARVRHILIVLVNSNNRPHLEWALKQDTPSTLDVAAAVSSDQINRYSLESIRTTDLLFTTWAQQLSTADHQVSFDFVRVDFEGVTKVIANMDDGNDTVQITNDVGIEVEMHLGTGIDSVSSEGVGVLKAWGDGGNDRLSGGHGNDILYGGAGRDVIIGISST